MTGELRCTRCNRFSAHPVHHGEAENPHAFRSPADLLYRKGVPSQRADRTGLWIFLAVTAATIAAGVLVLG